MRNLTGSPIFFGSFFDPRSEGMKTLCTNLWDIDIVLMAFLHFFKWISSYLQLTTFERKLDILRYAKQLALR